MKVSDNHCQNPFKSVCMIVLSAYLLFSQTVIAAESTDNEKDFIETVKDIVLVAAESSDNEKAFIETVKDIVSPGG